MATMSYTEARTKINAMQAAKDALGNRLYDDLEIANYFGYDNIETLNRILAQARVGYRKALINNAVALRNVGRSNAEIAEVMRLTEETVTTLLDSDIAKRLDKYKETDTARRAALENSQKEFDRLFSDVFGSPFRT